MSTPIPLAVAVRKIEPSSDSAATTTTPSARRRPAATGDWGHQSPVDAGDDHGARVDHADVGEGHCRGREKAPGQVLAASERADDERLQQPGLGVAADRRQREEDREHGAQEERAEHGQAEQGGARQRARVEAELVAAEAGDVLEQLARAPRVEAAEGQREHDDDREHAPAQRLAQGVRRRRRGRRSKEPLRRSGTRLGCRRAARRLHDGEIGVLERRADEADVVDALAGGDEALDDRPARRRAWRPRSAACRTASRPRRRAGARARRGAPRPAARRGR